VLVGRDRARLDAAVGRIGEGGPEVLAASADGRDEQALARILDPVGSVDHVLVTVGGLEGAGTIGKLTPEAVRSTLEARIWGALAAARVTAPRLPAGGSITLTSGVYSIRPVSGMTAPLAAIGAVEAPHRSARGRVRAAPHQGEHRPVRERRHPPHAQCGRAEHRRGGGRGRSGHAPRPIRHARGSCRPGVPRVEPGRVLLRVPYGEASFTRVRSCTQRDRPAGPL
jgi:hypothetical protein